MPYKDKASYKAKEKLDGGPKMMKSGFKMRSGSPFQRNFGIGASPMKDLTTAERSGEEAARLHNKNYQKTSEEQHEKDMHQIDRSGLTMKSPMKAHAPWHEEVQRPPPVPPQDMPERPFGREIRNPEPPNPVANLQKGPTQPDGTETWIHPELGLVDSSGTRYKFPSRKPIPPTPPTPPTPPSRGSGGDITPKDGESREDFIARGGNPDNFMAG